MLKTIQPRNVDSFGFCPASVAIKKFSGNLLTGLRRASALCSLLVYDGGIWYSLFSKDPCRALEVATSFLTLVQGYWRGVGAKLLSVRQNRTRDQSTSNFLLHLLESSLEFRSL